MLDLNRTKVNVNVTVTLKQYATINKTKVCPHTKFEISTANNVEDMLRTQIF